MLRAWRCSCAPAHADKHARAVVCSRADSAPAALHSRGPPPPRPAGEEFVRLQAEGDEQERARWRPGLPAGVLARGVAWWGPPRRHGGAAGVGAGAEGEEDEDEEGVGAGVLWRGANAR